MVIEQRESAFSSLDLIALHFIEGYHEIQALY